MNSKTSMISLAAIGMTVLILDAQTALSGAEEGLELCLQVVLPSLFPFVFLSVLCTGILAGRRIPWLRPLGRLCGIPEGAEGLLAVGLIGGYPVGAQCVAQAWRSGGLTEPEAHRMLGFCSNAGPSFLFGILGAVFAPAALWTLWGIHILSALLTGILLPRVPSGKPRKTEHRAVTPTEALNRSAGIMTSVCGWVILFRVLLAFARRWFLWLLPADGQLLFTGLLELTNGCCLLQEAVSPGSRFVLASVLLAFGGFCVYLQTVSVTEGLGTGRYFPGKLLQTAFSLLLAYPAQLFLYPSGQQLSVTPAMLLLPMTALLPFLIKIAKKPVAFSRSRVYNE